MQELWVQSLVGSKDPTSLVAKKKKKKQKKNQKTSSNTVTNSIKTLKMVHIKNNHKKSKERNVSNLT